MLDIVVARTSVVNICVSPKVYIKQPRHTRIRFPFDFKPKVCVFSLFALSVPSCFLTSANIFCILEDISHCTEEYTGFIIIIFQAKFKGTCRHWLQLINNRLDSSGCRRIKPPVVTLIHRY